MLQRSVLEKQTLTTSTAWLRRLKKARTVDTQSGVNGPTVRSNAELELKNEREHAPTLNHWAAEPTVKSLEQQLKAEPVK